MLSNPHHLKEEKYLRLHHKLASEQFAWVRIEWRPKADGEEDHMGEEGAGVPGQWLSWASDHFRESWPP